MPLTADRIDPAIIAAIRADCERVVAKTDTGFKLGVRGKHLFGIGACLGRMTLTDDGEAYHSMVGSVPVYNRDELMAEVNRVVHEAAETHAALSLFP